MKVNKIKVNSFRLVSLLIVVLVLGMYIPSFQNSILDSNNGKKIFMEENLPQSSETDYYNKEWIKYGNFSAGYGTYWDSITSGDTTDFNLAVSGGAATYKVMGEQKLFSLSESPIVGSNWLAVQNPDIPYLPDNVYSDSEGLKVYHQFTDNGDANQIPSAHWDRNFTMPVDMSDYEITSASIETVVNATVSEDVDVYSDYLNGYSATNGAAPLNQIDSFDYVRFYVLLSDLSKNKVYEIGYYQPPDLGAGNPPGTDYLTDTNLTTVSEDVLIFYLTSVLSSDNYNFTVTIGVRIYCADSSTTYDTDTFTELLIKTIDLSFTYEKKINQLNGGSWRQDAQMIPSNYIIENATLNFKYKIDKDWTTNTGSLNSEFRIIINTNQLGQTVKLTTATGTYQDFKVGGVDVTSFISPDQEVNLSIQVYIGDEFNLDTEITLSIDDVSLTIGYGIYTPPDETEYQLILNNVDRTTEKSTQVTFNENLNISLVYKDSLGDFIPDANIQLIGDGLDPITLLPSVYNNYYTIINSTDLGVGMSYLTLTASKRYYTTEQFQITIEVINRDTEIQLYLDNGNQTIDKEWTTNWNEDLNITIQYRDTDNTPSTHISNALVELTGVGSTKTLDEDLANEQYEIIINTFNLGVGSFFLTVYASRDNYSSVNIRFKITVTTRTTFLTNLELAGEARNSIEIAWNENFEIEVSYNDTLTTSPIFGATVQLIGTGYLKNFSPSAQTYTLSVDTFDLSIGNNFLTILAQKDNYSITSQLITITVEERTVILETLLNHTSTTTISFPHGELLNITTIYREPSGSFIEGATVQLKEGATVLYDLTQSLSFDQYSVEINTNELSLGANLLTLHAKQDNYSIAVQSITIIVDERDTSLDIYLDSELKTFIEKSYDETINVTIIYKDFSELFIDGAIIELREGQSLLHVISKHSSYDQYTQLINTKDLSLGINLLTIYATKVNYSTIITSITINVGERNTNININLDGTPGTAVQIPHNEIVNISVFYNDIAGPFLDGATVELREGESTLYVISKHPSLDQYTLLINTKYFNLGTNLLVIYAKKDNFTAAYVSISITVTERDTNLDVYLEENPTTIIEIPYGELLNITVVYSDQTGPFIDDATVELKVGSFVRDTFLRHSTFEQYYLTIDCTTLNLGSNIFSIYAKKENYSVALTSISIIVTERNTFLDIYLEEALTTTTEVTYGEFINITAIYKDFMAVFVDGATMELREGTTTLNVFSKHATLDQYYIFKNSNELRIGSNILSVYAKKENYSLSLVSIIITVNERDTTLDLLINNINTNMFEYYNVSINNSLNITAIYNDFEDLFVSGATLKLTGPGVSETLIQDLIHNQYSYILNAESLGVGVHFLVVSAEKENYSTAVSNLKINVLERGSNLQLFINGNNVTSSRYIAAEIYQSLNVTVFFTDSSDDSFISNANVKLSGALNDDFSENIILEHYNYTVDTLNLDQGINFLTVFAQKQEYISQSIVFTIEVIEKATNLQLFLNEKDETTGKSIKVTIGESVNITVIYEDLANNFIDNAEVILVGEGIDLNLTKHPSYDQYNVTILSDDLSFGINLLTLFAQRVNYQPQTLIVRIEIIEKETDMHVFLNGLNKTIDKTIALPIRSLLNVTIKFFGKAEGEQITGASIQLLGEGLNETLAYVSSFKEYYCIINTVQLDIGVKFLTIYAQRNNYQSYSTLLRIQVERIRTNITTVSGLTVINREPGQDYDLEIELIDLDFNTHILDATVTYTWTYGQGSLTDPDNNGVYEGTIANLREGTHVITISVYAGDDFEFERFTVTLNVVRPPEDILLLQVLTIVGVGAAVALGGYLLAYQRVLKYPKQIRTIKKFKSKLSKPKSVEIETHSRDDLIDGIYAEKIELLEKIFKNKLAHLVSEEELAEENEFF